MTSPFSQGFPLTLPQRDIWFDQLRHAGEPIYNIGGYLRLAGAIDAARFQRAAELLVQRHDVLRTVLSEPREGEVPLQAFAESVQVSVPLLDFSTEPAPEQAALDWMRCRLSEPFSLHGGELLFRYALIKLDAARFLYFGCYHHLIADGWTIALLARSHAQIYTAQMAGEETTEPATSYRAFIEDDSRYASSDALASQGRYWQSKYSPRPEPLFAARRPEAVAGPRSACSTVSLPWEVHERLVSFAQCHGATTFHLILAAVYTCLTRIERRSELVVGLPVLNRSNATFKGTAGLFVSVTAARLSFGTALSFRELLQAIGRELKENYRRQRFPLSHLKRDLSLADLFDVGVSYERHDHQALFGQTPSRAIPLVNEHQTHPLMLYVREFHAGEAVQLDFVYHRAYFDRGDVQAIQRRLLNLLDAAQQSPDLPVKDLPLMTAAEYRQVTEAWNVTRTDHAAPHPAHRLFEMQAEATPDAPALVFKAEQVSYQALNEKANRLAHRLLAAGVRPDSLVAVCAERSIEMVVGLLAVLKSGAAYVPLDPEQPPGRLARMLEELAGAVLLVQPALRSKLPLAADDQKVVALDLASAAGFPGTHPGVDVHPLQLAYTLYTSGSTGRPKGVGIPHGGLTNRLLWMQHAYRLTEADRVLQKTPFSFDVSVWEFFWPLMTGAVLVIAPPGDHRDPVRLGDLIRRERITTVHFVPSMLQAFIDHGGLPRCHSLHHVISSGEALPTVLQHRFCQQSQARLHNLYGPTEASIDVTAWTCDGHAQEVVPIGRPIANTRIYILDAEMAPVPVGVTGELHIGGVQLARGYHGRADLTAERFVPDPLGASGDRLYRTGDLARWRDDGTIEYLGRTDHQVKIRGLRIELGEIEAALLRHPSVKETVVVAHDDRGDKRLVAYLTVNAPLPAEDVRKHLEQHLPDGMIPSAFVALASMPLTANGKVDRKALPAFVDTQDSTRACVAPRTPTEAMLATLWAQLLALGTVGANDHFFKLGGHSLVAVRLIARLRELAGVELPLRTVFDAPVLHELALRVDAARGTAADTLPRPARADRSAPVPLSFTQQRMWFLDRLDAGNGLYHMAGGAELLGTLDTPALVAALKAVVARHEALRTSIQLTAKGAVQSIAAEPEVPVHRTDLSWMPAEQREHHARTLAQEEASRPFDLSRAPMIRAHVLRLAERRHWLLLTLHHIAADGRSLEILLQELAAFYREQVSGVPANLPPLPLQYADFAAWQHSLAGAAQWQHELDHWRKQLAGAPAVLGLPTDHPRPALRSHRGAHLAFELPADVTHALHAVAQGSSTTLFMTLLGAFGVLLSRYSGQSDLCIGTPVANRRHAEFDGLIGCFVNTLVLRLTFERETSFGQLLRQVRETALAAYAHQDVPFAQVVEALHDARSLSHAPLFQVMFALHKEPPMALAGLDVRPLDLTQPNAKFDLTLDMWETATGLRGRLEYCTDLFERATIERMAGHFCMLSSALTAQPDAPVATRQMLTPQEQRHLLEDLNRTSHGFPLQSSYATLFTRQAQRHPDRVAAVCGNQRLSYRELDERSTRIARALQAQGAGPDVLVGAFGERGLCFLAMMIGIIKSGAAYVPLDVNHPVQRLRDCVSRGGLALLLVTERSTALLDAVLPGLDAAPTVLVAERLWCHGDATAVASAGSPADLAYVIFTSGSTGQPKGAMVEHRGMLNNLYGKVPALGLGEHDRVAQTASTAFDISVWQFLAAPLLGGCVHILPDAVVRDPQRLLHEVAAQAITVLQLVPSMLRQLVKVPREDAAPLRSLRWVLSIGEALPPDLALAWFDRFPSVPLMNIYGPAECADNVAYHVLHSAEEAGACLDLASVPVGKPTANNQLFVLDAQLQPVPAGVPGEICVAGAGVGRGYLNDPATSAQAFIDHPFEPGSRFYRTGDLGRYRADGTIDYLGRRDHQIKIRGQRIELGEIEARLRACHGVHDAAVIARKGMDGELFLVGYWSPAAPQATYAEELRRTLSQGLPQAMVPTHLVMLDALPVNANGKLDRKALAAQPWQASSPRTVESPTTPGERELAAIWASLLGRTDIGRDDSFFRLGGHSLLAMQVTSRIRQTFGVDLPLQAVFEATTLRALGERIAQRQCTPLLGEPAIPRADRRSPPPASFAQQRMWFLDRLSDGSALYNMPVGLRLEGSFDAPAFGAALHDLARRHEVLRTALVRQDDQVVQHIASEVTVPLEVHDLGALDAANRSIEARQLAAKAAHCPFDLSAAPMLRAQVLHLGSHEHHLLLTLHHIAADGWSIQILVRELAALYRARCTGATASLEALPLQYADFAMWERHLAQGPAREQQLAYWRAQLKDAPPLLHLPTDHPRPAVPSHRGGRAAISLDNALTSRLRSLCRQTGTTLFMALSSAFALLLARYSGQDDVCIGTPVANRHREEVQGLIGLFVNTVVLRFRIDAHGSFIGLLEQARNTLLAAQAHQELPFDHLVAALQPERHLSHSPLFQAMIVLDHAPKEASMFGDLIASPLNIDPPPLARFDLTLHLTEHADALRGTFEFNADLFEQASMDRLARHARQLLEAIVEQPGRAASELSLMSAQEEHRILVEWNRTIAALPPEQTMHELFEACARTHANDIAVVFENEALTYATLNRRANHLAHRLRACRIGPDELVGVFMERSPDMIVAMLGVLKAGGAYLPLAPTLPPARLAYMVDDARPRLLLTQHTWLDKVPDRAIPCLCLDHPSHPSANLSDENPAPVTQPHHLAYVIYTSGSTGKPKGTLVPHRGLVNLVQSQKQAFGLERGSRVLQWASFNFDASVAEIFSTLSAGACLYLAPPEAVLPGRSLLDTLRRHRIETVTLTPSTLAVLPQEPLPDLKTLIVAGEACDHALIAPWLKHYTVINAYGPTEATVCATVHACTGDGQRHPPIGRPIANTQAYILDAHLHPVPIGVTGELYIGGEGLARGYLARPDLTADRFLQNPFSDQPGARMYRTGDLARYTPDGHIEYLGRLDAQVKLRGYRVELGEIECALADLPGVREAVVLAQPAPEGQCLVAYIVAETLSVDHLRAALLRCLPDHMVPAHFVLLDQLPINSNGKVDRPALDAIGWHDNAPVQAPPQTPTEQRLADLWCELLGRTRMGRHANFFQVGGHSLLAVRLLARIDERFGVSLPLSQLFRTPSIAQLALALDSGRPSGSQLVVPLQPGPRGAPIWLIHPAGGTVLCYRQLAERLATTAEVLAIQSPEVAGEDASTDFDGLCKRYAAEMLRIQPTGPFFLAGWSMGGALSLRIGELLEQAGHAVGWIALFDTMRPRAREKPQQFDEFVDWAMTRVPRQAWGWTDPEPATTGPGLDADTLAFLRRQYALQQAHAALLGDFIPGRLKAPLHVFRAHESIACHGTEPDWLRHTNAADRSSEHVVEGHHDNLLMLGMNLDTMTHVLSREYRLASAAEPPAHELAGAMPA